MATPEMRRDTCTLHHKAVLKLKEDAPPPGTSADHGLQQSLEAALNLPSVITAALNLVHVAPVSLVAKPSPESQGKEIPAQFSRMCATHSVSLPMSAVHQLLLCRLSDSPK